jgi:hypothetical protein
MTDDIVKTLGDQELAQLIVKAQAELAARARKRKEDTIAEIKKLAGAVGVQVAIKGARGRPPVRSAPAKSSRATAAK